MRVASPGLLAAAAIVASVVVAACKKPDPSSTQLTAAQQAAASPIHVDTALVVEKLMPEFVTLTGSLRASQESEVAADANGKVTSTLVERGQAVKKGEILAVLDARGASISASAASAQTGLARAQLEQAQRECERVKSLFQSGAISKAEFDRTNSQCQTTQFAAAAAQAAQQNAQKVVGDSVIRAPFAGVVGERYVNVGQYVQASTRICSLYESDPLRLELTVPESFVAQVKTDAPVQFSVAGYPGETFSGVVKHISPNVRPATRDFVVEAECPNAEGKLRPGMFGVAEVSGGERKAAVVPVSAVKKDEATARVFVVVDKVIQERIVKLGVGDKDGAVAVLAGAKLGESVVLNPGPDVRDGARVQ
jgi:membrane fusion protein, multidrug efflux system